MVERGGRDRLSFHIVLLLILYSPNSFLDIILPSDGVSSFVSFVIFSKVVIWRPLSLNMVFLLYEFHAML